MKLILAVTFILFFWDGDEQVATLVEDWEGRIASL